jgi:2-oxo-4-hydroxy-4-carboxy--5-ureidoimidazoline (OHCU) decarboxylase
VVRDSAPARPGVPKVCGLAATVRRDETVVDPAAPDLRLALIRVHPDLASKTQRAAGLTADSSGAGLDRLSDAEFQALSG